MAFKTKLDFSSNRQVKQHEATMTVLSGGTSFGLTFSALTSGPDLTTSGVSENYTSVASTFSGNDTTTIYTWYDPRMELAINTLSAITPSNSGITQNTGQVYAPSSITTIDGNTVYLAYTGVSFDINDIQVVELSPSNYSGTMVTYNLEILSANTLDFTGRTIWNDVSGITRTERLIITNNPQIGYVWTCSDSEGMGQWQATSGTTGTTGTTLYWYAENSTLPVTQPTAIGSKSISIGDAAESNDSNMLSFGYRAGNSTTGTSSSNFIGNQAGYQGTYSSSSNFIGNLAGFQSTYSTNSNFIGKSAGYAAKTATTSNFIGHQAGYGTISHNASNFIGFNVGNGTNNLSFCNYIGISVGTGANNITDSNFIGSNTGQGAVGCNYANFIGYYAGNGATGSTNSNFIGFTAGGGCNTSNHSNMIGHYAGTNSSGASYSNLFGYQAGMMFTNNFIGSNNIIIGTNISLPSGATNSINIGGVLFGTGTYTTTTGDPYITGNTGGKIGILTATPTQALDVVGSARFRSVGSLGGGSASLYIDTDGTLSLTASDERLKENITPIQNGLEIVKGLQGVNFDWKSNTQSSLGFIAQEVDKIDPRLTFVNKNTEDNYMGVRYELVTALLVEAVKELSLNNSKINTQTILAEDNNIELNYSGNQQTSIGGGISVLYALGDKSADIKTNSEGNWVTNNDFKPNALTIPIYTPTSSNDISGNEGNITRDDNFLYLKTINGWKRTNLESF